MSGHLIERVLKTIRNYDMLKPGDSVLVALSGGPDSVFLLRALHALKRKLKLNKLSVCNLDHGLRGKDSRDDSLFAKEEAGRLGLKFFHKKTDLRKIYSKKLSTEELARQVRYDFFQSAAKAARANVIATGHTLDDQAETVIMRIIKGSSLKGLVGIAPARKEKGLLLIRPLIEIEKDVIRKYLDEQKIPYVLDKTNFEPVYLRNVVRGEIIPFLEKYNPRLKRSVFNLAEHLREDFQFIKDAKAGMENLVSASRQGRCEIGLKEIVMQPGALQKEILRDALEKAGGEVKRLSFRHWKEIESLMRHKRSGSSVDLPGGIRVTRTKEALIFHPSADVIS